VYFLLEASIPAMGYATFFVRLAQKPAAAVSALKVSSDGLKNEFVRAEVNHSSINHISGMPIWTPSEVARETIQ
jgi:hypothetical protein